MKYEILISELETNSNDQSAKLQTRFGFSFFDFKFV